MAATHAVEGYDAFRSKVAELTKVGVSAKSGISVSSMWFLLRLFSHGIDEKFDVITGLTTSAKKQKLTFTEEKIVNNSVIKAYLAMHT